MKTLIATFIVAAVLGSCSTELANPDNSVNTTKAGNNSGHTKSLTNENRNSIGNQLAAADPSLKRGDFRVNSYEDDQYVSADYFRGGRVYKRIGFNTQTQKEDGEVRYYYKEDGSLDRVEWKEPNGVFRLDSDLTRRQRDMELQIRILRSYGINFPLPDIVANEVQDLSSILSAGAQYSDFTKEESEVAGNRKIMIFRGFNKTGRFPNSDFAYLIGEGDFIKIQDYELTSEDSLPILEVLKTNEGELRRTYSYTEGRLTGVAYEFTDLKNQISSLVKRFEYHKQ